MTKFLPLILTFLTSTKSSIYNIQSFYRNLENPNVQYLENYGCWCIFPNIMRYGHGHPLDNIDGICKQLHDNYHCLVQNFIARTGSDQNCDPEVTEYGFNAGEVLESLELAAEGHEPRKSYLTQLLNSQCRNKPGLTDCQKQVCLAEMNFLFEIHPQMTSNYDVFSPDNDRNDVLFNQLETCGIEVPVASSESEAQVALDSNNDSYFPGNISADEDGEHVANQVLQSHEQTQCCGINPNFLVYSPTKTNKECCRKASALFNPVTEICEGTHVVSLTSELDVGNLVLDLSGNFNNGGLPSFGRRR